MDSILNFGVALDDYFNKKKAHKAIGDLETQNKQSQQIGDAQSRTQQWLSSLSPEELTKMGGSKTSDYSLPKNDFNYDDKARDIQLKYGDVEGINDYFKNVQDSRVKSSLEDATKGMQREKQFADLQALEEKVGMPKGDYNLRSNRQVALDSGLPKFAGDPRTKDFMETYVEGPEKALVTKDGETSEDGMLRHGNRAGLIEYFNKPEKVKETIDQLDYFKQNFNLDEPTYEALKAKAQTGESYNVREYMSNKIAQLTKNELAIDKEYGLIDPRTQTKASTTKAGIQATKDEGAILSETAAERLGDFGASVSQLGELIGGLDNPDAPQGPIEQWKKVNPYDWQAQGKQQLVASTKQLVGKALEGGVLRKEDEDKYAKILPTMGDTYESAVLKTKQLSDMLNNAYIAKRTALKNAGYDVTKFSGGVGVKTKTKIKAGAVEDGYRFKGGNPSDPNSWEKVQ